MFNFSTRICLAILVSFIIIGFTFDDVLADEQDITCQIFSLENTSIIEFTNNSPREIDTIRIWLHDSSFNSIKSEVGWVTAVTPQGVVVFTTLESIKTNETVKFGIKTENSVSLIEWEVFDKEGILVETGKTQSQIIPSFVSEQKQDSINDLNGILFESTFKVIPENPSPGSVIRVAGENFVPNSSLELFLSEIKLESFEINENGKFVLTTKVPKQTKIEQVNFILKDKQEHEKTILINLTEMNQRLPTPTDLTVSTTENEFLRTDSLEYSGTANPNSLVTITIKNPEGKLFSSQIKNTNSQGNWSASINIPIDALIGKYFTEITDGKTTITESWNAVMSKNIHISPAKLKFNFEELIQFNVTANPDERINVKLVDPQGNNVLSNNFIVNPLGFFEIEYLTLPSSLKGTYLLYVFQKQEADIVLVGLGKSPAKILSAKLNHVNYSTDEKAIIGITGKSSEDIRLLILDKNGNEQFSDKIHLGPDGKRTYAVNLTAFPSGVYTLFVSMSDSKISEVFSVGLKYSSKPITFLEFDKTYYPNQRIPVIGTTEPYTVVNLFLIGPDGIAIADQESFAKKNGSLLIDKFVIPNDPQFGKWTIRAESGSEFVNSAFQVSPPKDVSLTVRVTDIISSSAGKFVTIEGFAIAEQTVQISIKDPRGNIIFQTNVRTTENGEFDLLWKVQEENIFGTYHVEVEDSFGTIVSTILGL